MENLISDFCFVLVSCRNIVIHIISHCLYREMTSVSSLSRIVPPYFGVRCICLFVFCCCCFFFFFFFFLLLFCCCFFGQPGKIRAPDRPVKLTASFKKVIKEMQNCMCVSGFQPYLGFCFGPKHFIGNS